MKNNIVVAIVGMCGTGKSITTEVFTENGWNKVYFGQVTMDKLKELGLEKNEKNEKQIREDLRKEHGQAAFAKLLLPKIRESQKNAKTVLDGLYSWSEYKILKDELKENMITLAIITNKNKRHERLKTREIRPLNEEEASNRDFSEIENLEKGGPISIADYYILNNGSIEELKEQVQEFITTLS